MGVTSRNTGLTWMIDAVGFCVASMYMISEVIGVKSNKSFMISAIIFISSYIRRTSSGVLVAYELTY